MCLDDLFDNYQPQAVTLVIGNKVALRCHSIKFFLCQSNPVIRDDDGTGCRLFLDFN